MIFACWCLGREPVVGIVPRWATPGGLGAASQSGDRNCRGCAKCRNIGRLRRTFAAGAPPAVAAVPPAQPSPAYPTAMPPAQPSLGYPAAAPGYSPPQYGPTAAPTNLPSSAGATSMTVVVAPYAPPPPRVETPRLSPPRWRRGSRVTGSGMGPATTGCQDITSIVRRRMLTGCPVIGSRARTAGSGSKAAGAELPQVKAAVVSRPPLLRARTPALRDRLLARRRLA